MTYLVAGATRVDAGKTTFSTGLVAATGAVGFKPRAGNDYWFDHDDVRTALAAGRLYGADADKLAAASPGTLEPEDVNPVHRLWQPSPGEGAGLLGQPDREFVVDRVGERYVVNGTVTVPDPVRDHLPLADATVVGDLQELNAVMGRRHLPAMAEVGEAVRAADTAVVESYGDVARPYRAVEPEAVAVVEPGRARLYDGPRFRKACEVTTGGPGEGQLEERVDGVVDLLDPAETVPLPPLAGEDRADPERVSRAYEPAYESLRAIAAGG